MRLIAHAADPTQWPALLAGGLLIAAVLLLVVEHVYVAHGRLSFRHFMVPCAVIVTLGLSSLIMPVTVSAFGGTEPQGLPDLISDPPFIWNERDLVNSEGEVIHVLTFDGFLHNIGEGALDIAGNPQIEGEVTQRVFDGAEWVDVGTPTVRYETDDGHRHFHLISAADYALWDDARTGRVGTASKIGFCLIDTRQVEERFDATYTIDAIEYCAQDKPETTDLRMGITPGWHDIYESSTTLQWVDVSNTAPGRYWIGAIIDPNDEIVESDETNNDTVFSLNRYSVSGYVARQLDRQTTNEIRLKSDVYGTVGRRAFVIVDGPEHGSLSVPTGVDLLTDTVTYQPEVGFTGQDVFTYLARDTNSPFPFEPETVTVEVAVGTRVDTPVGPDLEGAAITGAPDLVTATRYERFELALGLDDSEPAGVQWFASDLPPGLTIDPQTGVIAGELTAPGTATSRIVAQRNTSTLTTEIDWEIADSPRASLRAVNDFSMPMQRRDWIIGAGTGSTTYEATGLPDGMILTPGQPTLSGTPTEIGDFDVTVTETLDGEIVDTVRFRLAIRPIAEPSFVL